MSAKSVLFHQHCLGITRFPLEMKQARSGIRYHYWGTFDVHHGRHGTTGERVSFAWKSDTISMSDIEAQPTSSEELQRRTNPDHDVPHTNCAGGMRVLVSSICYYSYLSKRTYHGRTHPLSVNTTMTSHVYSAAKTLSDWTVKAMVIAVHDNRVAMTSSPPNPNPL
jgi:hypothetical protein